MPYYQDFIALKLRAKLLVSFCLLIIASTGCTLWSQGNLSDPSQLPALKMSEETVILEIAKVYVTKQQLENLSDIWEETDEQFLDHHQRRKLEANGFRVGLITYHLPEALRNIIEQGKSKPGLNGEKSIVVEDKAVQVVSQQRFRRGKRNELIASKNLEQLTLLSKENDQLRGDIFYGAQAKFAIMAHAEGDGRVLVQLSPEIHHGESKQHYQAEQGVIRIENRKQRKIFNQLEIKALFTPGQTMILGLTPEVKGVGKAFFTDPDTSETEQRLLLIRIAGSQYDNLFQTNAKIVEESPVMADSMPDNIPASENIPTFD